MNNLSWQKAQLAKQLVDSSDPQRDEVVVVAVSEYGRDVAEMVMMECEARGAKVFLDTNAFYENPRIINDMSLDKLDEFAKEKLEKYEGAKKTIKILNNTDPKLTQLIDIERWTYWQKLIGPLQKRIMNGDLFYTLTVLPTVIDAELDGVDFDNYVQLFFELCNQPWKQIAIAQDRLIEGFDKARQVRITNNDGTDVTFDIDGFTFVNSVVAKNIPGAEIFSAPNRRGVNGRIVAKGKFQEGSSGVIEDITLEFKDGRIVDFAAVRGQADLSDLITVDDALGEGTRHLGELGIGTNPHLRQHVINGLLVEKIGGSFHVALGNAYEYTEYCGRKVNLDNGNRSKTGVHWDLTTMLRDKEGRMYLDGQVVQANGDWLGEEFEVLNKGWGAVNQNEQPDWWQTKFEHGYN